MKKFDKKLVSYKIHKDLVLRLYVVVLLTAVFAYADKGLGVAVASVLPLLLIILIFKWYVGFSYYINNVYYGRIRKDGGRDQRYSKHYTKVKVNIYKGVEVANLDRYLEQKQQHFTRFVVRFYALKSMALKKKVKSRPIVSSILFITLALFSVVFVRLYFTALGLDI